ncbi:MAG TPA: hypothetical protein VKC63_06520 [Solirubrobacterales bacterium]|nr:hypothetical protein [Solirubrobacterales bacterium]
MWVPRDALVAVGTFDSSTSEIVLNVGDRHSESKLIGEAERRFGVVGEVERCRQVTLAVDRFGEARTDRPKQGAG